MPVLVNIYVINLFVSFHYHYDEYVDTLDSPISLICSTESKYHKSVVATTMSTSITCTTITSNNILELKKGWKPWFLNPKVGNKLKKYNLPKLDDEAKIQSQFRQI